MSRAASLLLLLCCLVQAAWAQQPDYESGRVLLKLREGAPLWPDWQSPPQEDVFSGPAVLAPFAASYQLQAVRRPFRTHSPVLDLTYEVRFRAAGQELALIDELQALPEVEYAERVPIYYTQFTPNDLHPYQWHLNKIEAPAAWNLSKGSPAVVVAVVDDAMLVTHDDLAPVVWTNPNELANGLDDDGNGIVDDLHGADLADDDADPNPPAGADHLIFAHGTHTSGIATAATDNGTGIASIGFNVRLMPVKAKFDSTIGSGGLEATMEGVDYAIATGADIINMSFGGGGASSSWQALIDAGYFSGITFVGAAGNDNSFKQFFPASYNHVISVSGTDFLDQKSSFSNWHYSVDVMAPGSGIYSTVPGTNSNYDFMSGTSMSSPLAAGLCALILSADSTLSPSQIEDCLTAGCDNIDAMNPDYVGFMGFGRINALHSLACAAGVGVDEGDPVLSGIGVAYPQPAVEEVIFPLDLEQAADVRLTLTDLQGRVLEVVQDGRLSAGQHFLHWQRGALPAGVYMAMWEVEGRTCMRRVLLQ
jgi:hypothetical protein